MSLRPPELSSNYGNMVKLQLKKKLEFSASIAADSPAPTEKPEIELEFIGPKAESETAKAISGEKLLRNIMLDNKIELYATYGKVMNCGGGGSCGTCIVEIIDGKDLLNERTNTELRYLKKANSLSLSNAL
uniref:2Fe-2S ferredoxin-type domain-containing protein n=1 Tax=Fagus sylvatica TaxID=28930 RepID=A0A2N9IQK3_FAGSY